MKKILLSTLLLLGVSIGASAQVVTTVGRNTHVMCMTSSNVTYIYYATDSAREASVRNISLQEAFPDGNYDSTSDGICFLLRRNYFSVYLGRTRTKYTSFNKSLSELQFAEKFLRVINNIRDYDCKNFEFK